MALSVLHSAAIRFKRPNAIEQCGILNRFICIVPLNCSAVLVWEAANASSPRRERRGCRFLLERSVPSLCRPTGSRVRVPLITRTGQYRAKCRDRGSGPVRLLQCCKHPLSLTARISFPHFEDVFSEEI